jgi:hypothetical protein
MITTDNGGETPLLAAIPRDQFSRLIDRLMNDHGVRRRSPIDVLKGCNGPRMPAVPVAPPPPGRVG